MINRKALSARVRRAIARTARYRLTPFFDCLTDKAETLLEGDLPLSEQQREALKFAVEAAYRRMRSYEVSDRWGMA